MSALKAKPEYLNTKTAKLRTVATVFSEGELCVGGRVFHVRVRHDERGIEATVYLTSKARDEQNAEKAALIVADRGIRDPMWKGLCVHPIFGDAVYATTITGTPSPGSLERFLSDAKTLIETDGDVLCKILGIHAFGDSPVMSSTMDPVWETDEDRREELRWMMACMAEAVGARPVHTETPTNIWTWESEGATVNLSTDFATPMVEARIYTRMYVKEPERVAQVLALGRHLRYNGVWDGQLHLLGYGRDEYREGGGQIMLFCESPVEPLLEEGRLEEFLKDIERRIVRFKDDMRSVASGREDAQQAIRAILRRGKMQLIAEAE